MLQCPLVNGQHHSPHVLLHYTENIEREIFVNIASIKLYMYSVCIILLEVLHMYINNKYYGFLTLKCMSRAPPK